VKNSVFYQGKTLQAAEKLSSVSGHDFTGCEKRSSVSGHDFTGCEKRSSVSGHDFTGCEKRSSVSGHDFAGCGKTHVLYQGATLQAAEKLMFCIRARLYRLRKNSCFVSGHDFSRAVKIENTSGFSP
jgi:hypothetical protein